MKITIEFNSKRIKNLRNEIEIEKKISKTYENSSNRFFKTLEKEREEHYEEIRELKKNNEMLLEVVAELEKTIKTKQTFK